MKTNLDKNIDFILNEIGKKSPITVKKFLIGKNKTLNVALIFVNGLMSRSLIDRDILNPLMIHVNEELIPGESLAEYISQRYIPMGGTKVEEDINKVIESIKIGKTAMLVEGTNSIIVIDTIDSTHYRAIADPPNESAIRGSREGFVENIGVNISILRRKIKDKNLTMENLIIGKRSQTDVVIMYIDDIVDKDVLKQVRNKLNSIDVDSINAAGMIEQYIEDSPYSVFPQAFNTERPDIVKANLMEGKIAILVNGNPSVITVPAVFIEFFQAVEDYYERTIVSSFARILRILAVFMVITLPSIYLTLIQYNAELIPIKFINPIVQSREGIALTPFLEILAMEVVVEFLREGGLRLPPKIAGTLSIVGGIIIGNTAIESRIVSPTTLLVVGISVLSTFLVPNYEMSLSIRFIRFPMLVLANTIGFMGIAAGWFFLMVHLFSLESYGVPYVSIKEKDMKDIFIRAPLWMMNKRPEAIPNNNQTRQNDFRKQFKGEKDE
ncbi:spore germination protein [Oceanirhabdus seepicola]|uniref:Spore germination protein n=1 Tax=Oceanirhabdus seepicola TaxID=2828781 RepID=A0A9J6P1N3_9CLOT|nr:spore germination protein [Oceanirhabdus seepicola]MCM1989953.1 spore germination protein [Oceanirhabdus seepicola]